MATGPYISPRRFAIGGFGIDTTPFTTPQLRSTLQRATTMVNTWCNGSMLPQPFDFRGGTVTNELHGFPLPDPLVAFPGSRRVFPYQRPLRTVTGFAIQFTHRQDGSDGYQIVLNVDTDLFVNTTENWVEIVASQPTIIGYPPIGYWYGLYEPQAMISYTYGYRNAVTDDELVADSTKVFYASYGQWSDDNVTVTVDDIVIDPGDYAVNRADGSVTFTTAPATGATVLASYTTTIPDAIVQGTALVAVDLMAQSRIAARGLIGLQSIKVAEVAITQMSSLGAGRYVARNGVSIPENAAAFLNAFATGRAA